MLANERTLLSYIRSSLCLLLGGITIIQLDGFESIKFLDYVSLIGLHSRLANFQKIDRIIFNDRIKDPRTDQKWEWHNP